MPWVCVPVPATEEYCSRTKYDAYSAKTRRAGLLGRRRVPMSVSYRRVKKLVRLGRHRQGVENKSLLLIRMHGCCSRTKYDAYFAKTRRAGLIGSAAMRA